MSHLQKRVRRFMEVSTLVCNPLRKRQAACLLLLRMTYTEKFRSRSKLLECLSIWTCSLSLDESLKKNYCCHLLHQFTYYAIQNRSFLKHHFSFLLFYFTVKGSIPPTLLLLHLSACPHMWVSHAVVFQMACSVLGG